MAQSFSKEKFHDPLLPWKRQGYNKIYVIFSREDSQPMSSFLIPLYHIPF
ncbi:hypothetical protein HMPREF9087_2809 [Enterococcus casseliflavus ATCC 12755]|uniref:Uncharacterized protein n=1 Tax=Enterococcus casseliflavus ATCC 12755 TaxID=888066 RepID=F0EN17_ENTCA|nr:hypothetical protein HMPREF9087_2809 [Enterococcus casseliflavus ATCC 12755]